MAKTVQEILADIDAQIETLTANPPVDWTEGDVSVKASQKLTGLLKMREVLMSNPTPEIAIMKFSNGFDEFGIDMTEYM